jgi:hypothetical protein
MPPAGKCFPGDRGSPSASVLPIIILHVRRFRSTLRCRPWSNRRKRSPCAAAVPVARDENRWSLFPSPHPENPLCGSVVPSSSCSCCFRTTPWPRTPPFSRGLRSLPRRPGTRTAGRSMSATISKDPSPFPPRGSMKAISRAITGTDSRPSCGGGRPCWATGSRSPSGQASTSTSTRRKGGTCQRARHCSGLQRFGLLLHRNPAGLVTLAAGYRFADHWIARFHWNRVAARDDRDADMFVLGVGYRWNR